MSQQVAKFSTERTRRFRTNGVDPEDETTISNIENFGCSVIHVKPSDTMPGWSYTIGIFDTCGQPEIIQIGLKQETAHHLLNNAENALREGIDLSQGRHSEMIGNVECEFRPVDPKWIKQVMGWAAWYYAPESVPVLQAVYPDIENRFPEDEGFNDYFEQPLLQPDAPMGCLEEDFWSASDPNSSLFKWEFPNPPHTGVYLSKTVHSGAEPVTYVSHDFEDGAWQFLGDSMSESGGVLSCFHHPIDRDPSIAELADLPLGWYAERETPAAPWIRRQKDPEEPSNSSASA